MWVGDEVVVGVGCEWKGKGETQKHAFWAARAVYVHYFKDIRQGALQSDYVMLMLRAGSGLRGFGMTLSWGSVGV